MLRDENVLFRFRGPFGIEVQLGASMLMLVGFLLYTAAGSASGLINTAIWVAILIGSIFLHELGHAWACEVQGVRVRRIMLHGGGGFCEQTRSASIRQSELIVAMGPLVNLALWALTSLAAWYFTPVPASLAEAYLPTPTWVHWLETAAWLNMALFIFNLLPVQPLDGGKLLALALRRVLPGATATRIAGWIGFAIAMLWIPAALFMFLSSGWILFFFPSVRLHWHMAQGRLAA